MRSKYVVFYERDYDVTNGHSSYSRLKPFRNEADALAFIYDPKNLRIYGEMFLEHHTADGLCYEWDGSKKEWVLK